MMSITRGTIAQICLVWAFALLLGLSFGLNAPLVLILIYTILILIG